jgi:hypothetical protein
MVWQICSVCCATTNYPVNFHKRTSRYASLLCCRTEDAGVFTCSAENDAGNVSVDIKLTVHGKDFLYGQSAPLRHSVHAEN